ncbi:Nuclear pore protein 84 / 107 [Gracilaria domingensis]|nr:Nuclear pore protein 84 / 107 [Gracilaria domingensis]
MAAITPASYEPRRLTFTVTPRGLQDPLARPLPSPYTPSSRRRSGSLSGSGAQHSEYPENGGINTTRDFSKAEEAERYVSGDLTTFMRGLAIDTVSAFHKSSAIVSQVESATQFVSQIINGLQEQLHISDELAKATSLRAASRLALQRHRAQLRLEYNAWNLLLASWRNEDVRSDDLCTRRLALSVIDDAHLSTIPGYTKLQRIAEWLERLADSALEREGGVKLKPLDDPAYRWEYTASRVADNEPVSMDFPIQNENKLDNVERKAEARLSQEVFKLVRAGRLSEAEEICRHVNQPWRAAVLGGGKRASLLAANGVKGQARRIWRKAATAIARSRDVAILPHERAVCAALCGVLEPLLAVAETYEDEAWARISVLLDGLTDRALVGGPNGDCKVDDSTILQSFAECQNSGKGSDGISSQLLKGIRNLQAFMALGPEIGKSHLCELFDNLGKVAELALSQEAEWLSRFVAQLCLFFKFSGRLDEVDPNSDLFDNFDTAVQSYAKLVINLALRKEEKAFEQRTVLRPRPLVYAAASYFLAELKSPERTIESYVILLAASLRHDFRQEKIEAGDKQISGAEFDDRRTLCLASAGQCFRTEVLQRLVVCAVDVIWKETLPSNRLDRSISDFPWKGEISEDDQLVVRAIRFLTFPAFTNVVEALRRVTRSARSFFLAGKRKSAKYAIDWFPRDILQHLREELCKEALQEYKSWIAYHDALEMYHQWNVFHSSSRPMPLPDHVIQAAKAPPGNVNYTEQSSAKVMLQDYEQSVSDFETVCAKKRKAAVETLKSALLFEGGWMQDLRDQNSMQNEDEAEGDRQAELKMVRSFAVPQLVMLLHQVLHESGLYSEAMELANIVAAEEFKLYDSFGPAETRAFLGKVAGSAVAVADQTIRAQSLKRPYEGTFFEELPS